MTTGTEGNDSLQNDQSLDTETINALGGDDLITINIPPGNPNHITVDGGTGFDIMQVNAFQIFGNNGEPNNRLFVGNSHTEHVLMTYNNLERIIVSAFYQGSSTIFLGAAQDWFTFTGTANSRVSVNTGAGDDRVIFTNHHPGADITMGDGDDFVDLSAATMYGSNPLVVIRGGNGSDKLVGSSAADVLQGGEGVDVLIGMGGNDSMSGGLGNDIYVAAAGDSINELAGEGYDYVYVTTDFTIFSEIEVLATEDAAGTAPLMLTGSITNNSITGNAGDNSLQGGGGNDYLTGLAGVDVLDGGEGIDFTVGGAGGDIHYVDNPADIVLENVGEGYDAIYTSTSIGLREGVEVERIGTMNYLAVTDIYLTGNEFGQDLIANNGNNQLSGMGGNDYLVGLDGVDILDGGTGADVMEGGAGGDIYYIDNAGDVVREMAGGGQDALYTTASYMLSAGASVETLGMINYLGTEAINLGGNEFDNTVTGNNGNNILTGGGGSDYLNALEGNDVVDGGAGQDLLSGGAGADTYRFERASDSTTAAADTIMDFVSGTDRIDLSLVDANSNVPGRDSFSLIGSNAFSGKAGELRWTAQGSQTLIFGDTNGDGTADFQIVVNSTLVVASDFMV